MGEGGQKKKDIALIFFSGKFFSIGKKSQYILRAHYMLSPLTLTMAL